MLSIKEKYIKFLLYTLVIILVNIAGITLFFRADLTRGRVFSLSEASKEVAATLTEPLTIKVFFSKDLPAPHNNTERYLKDLLEEYAARGGKLFNYTFYNVTPDEETLVQKADENRELARSYGISPVQIRIMENDEVKFKNAYMGLVIIHGDLVEKIAAVTSTQGLEYKITAAVQKMNKKVSTLHRLDKKVKVNVYLSTSLYPVGPLIGLEQLSLLTKVIEKNVAELNKKNLGILEYRHIDVRTQARMEELGEKYDLMTLSWPAVPEKKIPEGFGAAGLVVEFGENTVTMPLIHVLELPIIGTTYQMSDPHALSEELNRVMEKMIGINKDIGYLSSHDTLPIGMNPAMMGRRQDGGLKAFDSLISSRYTIRPVDLKKGMIPDGLNCLIIARPTKAFTEYELFQIDQALMKGTSIAFFSDSFQQINLGQRGMGLPPMFQPIDTGLDKLLNHYGVKITKGYVLDEQCYRSQVPPEMGGGEQKIYFAPILKNEAINTDPAFMKNIKGLVTMQISPVELIKERIDAGKISAVKLLTSSERSWIMDKQITLNPPMIRPPADDKAFTSHAMAYLLEGKFTSYFKGKPIPKKETPKPAQPQGQQQGQVSKTPLPPEPEKSAPALKNVQAANTTIETGKPAKIFILPSSAMIQDTVIDPQGQSMNAIFILNAIDHLNAEDDMAVLRAKQQSLNPLAETSPASKAVIKGFNIIGLPILVAFFGLGVMVKRTSKKRKLAKRFNG